MLERILFNLRGPQRYDYLDGKRYRVVNCVSITEGVWEGSQGPLFYPKEELGKFVSVWNMKPSVVYHPERNGEGISATTDTAVIESRGIGFIFNTSFGDGKLKHEIWIDEAKANKVDKRVIQKLDKGEKIEVSTGLFTENEKKDGEHGGKKYVAIARNYRPDHLAILPDKLGACSVADGAGLLANEDTSDLWVEPWLTFNRYWSKEERNKLAPDDFGDPDRDAFPVAAQQDVDNAATLISHAKDPETVKKRIAEIGKRKGLNVPPTWVTNEEQVPLTNSVSHGRIRESLNAAIRPKMKALDSSMWPWVVDVYDKKFVYSDGSGSGLMMATYSVDKTGQATVQPKPHTPVYRHFEYRTTGNGAYVGNMTAVQVPNPMKGQNMTKQEMVDHLVKNGWTDADKDWLNTLDDTRLTKLIDNATKPAIAPPPVAVTPPVVAAPVVPVANTPKVLTEEEYIQQAPAGIREMLQEGMVVRNSNKKAMIDAILLNKANRFTKEQLELMPLGSIQAIAVLASPAPANNGSAPNPGYPAFIGAGTSIPLVNEGPKKPDALPLPTLNERFFPKTLVANEVAKK